ncbi:hypothetical protein GCM10009122_45170 [Fulvivirga kasyanovii]|uniref:SDR family NAD(P)-dependent oxidoreductase n=1 Tax=Fulvivirga kasyanovii TaxID=396812 RepID=A0ABW9RQ19_9BACT|nr:SDR family NAD(P)-dependent oxidoreductase [Fulvivirga kasyanovii]MTI25796.1 SDR family NAD(P)-dependent oxidoreductase [Fulvivirga kasyanovii]
MTANKLNKYILVITGEDDFIGYFQQWVKTPVVEVRFGLKFEQKSQRQFCLPPTEEGYQQLFQLLGGVPDTIVNYQMLDQSQWIISRLHEYVESSYHHIMGLAKAIIKQKPSGKIKWLYSYSFSGQSYLRPFYSAINGLMRTLHIEFPVVQSQCVELRNRITPSQDTLVMNAETIASHIGKDWDKEVTEVRYTDGELQQRRLSQVKEAELSGQSDSTYLRNDGVYLVTGGLGGIGLIISRHLAKSLTRPTLILVGRTELDSRRNGILSDLRSFDANVDYMKADIASERDVEGLVATVKKNYGHINGIIHCAGILRDNFIIKKSSDESEAVIAPKVYGTVLLDHHTRSEPLDFFFLFSSISGVMGNLGQADYAYANRFLNCFAEERTALQKQGERAGKTVAISWPLWSNGGMQLDQNQLHNLKDTFGMVPISDQEGVAIFEKALSSKFSQFMVMKGRAEKIDRMVKPLKDEPDQKEARTDKVISAVSEKELVKCTKDFVKQLIANVTELPLNKIKETAAFEKFGIDSFAIMKLNNELEQSFGELSKTLFFEYQNVNDLVDYLIKDHHQILLDKFDIAEEVIEIQKDESYPSEEQVQSDVQAVSASNETVTDTTDIAIIGVAGNFPGADTLQEFWQNLSEGKNCISEIPEDRWPANDSFYSADKEEGGKSYTKWGGFIKDIDKFDPLFFNISPAEAELMDPQERLLLQTVWSSIEDAGYTAEKLGTDVGVFMGSMYKHYPLVAKEPQAKALLSSTSYWSIVNRLSYFMNFQGPSIAIDTACASSLTAVYMACHSIWRGECEVSIAGGVNLSLHPDKYIGLSATKMIGSSDKSNSFGQGDGYVPGEGIGAMLLKPLSKAVADKDHIYAVVKAAGANHSGRTSGFSVPGLNAQKNLIVKTIKQSGCPVETISYMESAANGSPFGDAIEVNAINKALSELTDKKEFCAIGTVKSNIGHLEAASGVSQLIKVLMQMKHGKIVPTINAEFLNENITLKNSPVFLQKELVDWEQPESISAEGIKTKIPRRAGINSFGAGGSNVHLVLEEYLSGPESQGDNVQPVIVMLSAQREEALNILAKQLLDHIGNEADISLTNIAHTLMHGRQHMDYRLALVVQDKEDLKFKLEQIVKGDTVAKGCYWGKVDEDKVEELSRLLDDEILSVWIKEASYDKITDAWVQGLDINFSELPQSKYGRKVSLPTYPFDKRSYWIGSDSDLEAKAEKLTLDSAQANEDPLRKEIKSILSEIFKIPEGEIEDNKNLARYGMDSLSGMRFINKVQEKFDIRLSARVLLKHPNVNSFYKMLGEKLKEMTPAKVEAPNNKQEEAGDDLTTLLQKLYSGEVSAQEALANSEP